MDFDDKDLRHLESLSRISLDRSSREKFRIQLARILDFVKYIDRIDTSDIDATGGADLISGGNNGVDIPSPSLDRDEALRQAPESEDGYFMVPRTIREEGGAV